MIFLSVLPLRVSAGVGEHPDKETLGKLLTLTADKRSLDIVLEVSEIGEKIRLLFTRITTFSYPQMSFPIVLPLSRFFFLMLGSLRERVLENFPN